MRKTMGKQKYRDAAHRSWNRIIGSGILCVLLAFSQVSVAFAEVVPLDGAPAPATVESDDLAGNPNSDELSNQNADDGLHESVTPADVGDNDDADDGVVVTPEPAMGVSDAEEARANQPLDFEGLMAAGDLTVAPIADVTFSGSAIEPEVMVQVRKEALSNDADTGSLGGDATAEPTGDDIAEPTDENNDESGSTEDDEFITLKQDEDYTVTYLNNLHAGTATVTIKGVEEAGFTGEIRSTFTIQPASVAGARVTGLTAKSYTGKAINQMPVVKVAGRTLAKGTDYTVSFKNNVKVGSAKVVITGKGDYTGSLTKTFAIRSRTAKSLTWSGLSMSFKTSVQKDNPLPAKNAVPKLWQTGQWTNQKLQWKAPKDKTGIDGYIILRQVKSGKYYEIAKVGKNRTSYIDNKASKKNTWYSYAVVAYKKTGKTVRIAKSSNWTGAVLSGSTKTNSYNPAINKKTAKIQRGDKVTLKLAYPASTYSKKTRWYTSNAKVATVSGGVVTGKIPGTVTITARTANGRDITCKVTVTERRKPGTPKLTIPAASNSSVVLHWNPTKDANRYDVYAAKKVDDTWQKPVRIARIKRTTYTHKNLVKGTVYRYYVIAHNVGGGGDTAGTASNKVVQTVKIKKAATTISGVPAKVNKLSGETVAFTVSISPALGGRTLRLQQYDSAAKKWRTRKTYKVADAYNGKVKMTIDAKWRQRTTGKWRVVADGNTYAKSKTSRTLTVTTPNVGSCYVSAASACIYCVETGQFIYTKNSKVRRAQASTTKIMTAVLLVESGKLSGTTTVSYNAAYTPGSKINISQGDRYGNLDLLYAMMLPSANDAATAVIETVGGGYSRGVAMMNSKAQALGLKDTHFANPHGLDAYGHYTSAKDLAKLTAYAYQKPIIRTTWLTSRKYITSYGGKSHSLVSTDKLIGYNGNFKGGKTGTTDNAACCFAGVYTYGGKTYVTVVLGTGYGYTRWTDTKNLHTYIRNYAGSSY